MSHHDDDWQRRLDIFQTGGSTQKNSYLLLKWRKKRILINIVCTFGIGTRVEKEA